MKLKTLYLTTLVLLALITLPTIYVAGASSTTFTLSQGVYPSDHDFTIFRDGSTYYAKNNYGAIPYDGTNFTLLTNTVITNIPNAEGSIYFPSGTYVLSGSIQLKGKVELWGEGYLQTTFDASGLSASQNAIEIVYDDGALQCGLYQIEVDGGGNAKNGIWLDGGTANLEVRIERVHVSDFVKNGLVILDAWGSIVKDSQFYDNEECGVVIAHSHAVQCHRVFATTNGVAGFNLTAGDNFPEGASGGCDSTTFYGCISQIHDVGMLIGDGWTGSGHGRARATTLIGCHFESNINDTIIDQWSYQTNIIGGEFSSASNYSIVILDARYTNIVNPDLTSYPASVGAIYEDANAQKTTILYDGYFRPSQMPHPTTTGWGADEAGRMWYCTTHDDVEYWNGTDIVQLP